MTREILYLYRLNGIRHLKQKINIGAHWRTMAPNSNKLLQGKKGEKKVYANINRVTC